VSGRFCSQAIVFVRRRSCSFVGRRLRLGGRHGGMEVVGVVVGVYVKVGVGGDGDGSGGKRVFVFVFGYEFYLVTSFVWLRVPLKTG
jgi:hypothetical protein